MEDRRLGKYLTLERFCTCTQTYQKYTDRIYPLPKNEETILAIEELVQFIVDPIIQYFGEEKFQLTYGFCSADLKKYLEQKDPITGLKNGRVAPTLDQHMAYEVNKKGQYYCQRLGAACDFLIVDTSSSQVIDWILEQKLPFDSLYFYGENRPIHISYGPQHKRDLWTFTASGQPTKRGIQQWIYQSRSNWGGNRNLGNR